MVGKSTLKTYQIVTQVIIITFIDLMSKLREKIACNIYVTRWVEWVYLKNIWVL